MRIQSHPSNSTDYQLRRVVCLYETTDRAAATLHTVKRNGSGTLTIQPGAPLDRSAFLDIATRLDGAPSTPEATLIPASLLYLSDTTMLWHAPPRVAPIFFITKDKVFDAAVNGHRVLHPALLFKAARGTLFVWALPSAERPSLATKLCNAPYFNTYGSGALCPGNSPLPQRFHSADIPQWEKVFYETNFTHTNFDLRKLCKHPHGHNAMWRELLQDRRAKGFHKLAQFPPQWLAPHKPEDKPQTTVAEVLS